jgi:flagellar basal-body rod modification protein FlgD
MQVTPTTTLYQTDANYVDGSTRTPVQSLNQNDFLKLVMAQLTHQDPLDPQKDTEFIAQMTQFSSLEQAKSMQSDMEAMRNEQQLLQANELLGRSVHLQDDQGALTAGTVTSIQLVEGTPQLVVNGSLYDLSALVSVEPATTTTP